MSTKLKSLNKQVTLTRFWGGERGSCVQVTQSRQPIGNFNPFGVGYVQLTRDEAGKLADLLYAFSEGKEKEANYEDD